MRIDTRTTEGSSMNITPQAIAAAVCPFVDENMVVAGLVHHDAKDEVAKIGDTVSMNILDRETKLDEIIWTEFFLSQEVLDQDNLQDIAQIYLVPSARSLTRSVDLLLFELLSKAVTGQFGPLRTDTLRQDNARACLNLACDHFDTKETPEEYRYLILQPGSKTEVLKAGCVNVNHMGPDALLGRCVGGFEGWVAHSLGMKLGKDGEYLNDEGAPSAYAWHRDAMAIATRRRAPDEGYDEAFLSGSGLGIQVGTRRAPKDWNMGEGLLVRLSVLFGLEVLDPSLVAIFQDLP
jgi:hypothetical protein